MVRYSTQPRQDVTELSRDSACPSGNNTYESIDKSESCDELDKTRSLVLNHTYQFPGTSVDNGMNEASGEGLPWEDFTPSCYSMDTSFDSEESRGAIMVLEDTNEYLIPESEIEKIN